MKKIIFRLLFVIFVIIVTFFFYFFLGETKPAEEIEWGVVFSQKHSQLLGLDWQKVYWDILDDLKIKNIKIIVHWDLIEPAEGEYYFKDLDWQIKKAEERGTKVILVIGLKTGRWPECHAPHWAECEKLGEKCKNSLFKYLEEIVRHYQDSKAIIAWQIENEPFFPFGECPKIKKDFVKKEIELVKKLEKSSTGNNRPIIFADSGEFSFWISAATLGDIVSATLHRRVYFKEIGNYFEYKFPPIYYWRKAKIIEKIFKKKVIIGELQAEPWCKNLLYNCSLEEQEITMNARQLKKNIQFAKETGLDTIYLWGAEWWYWMKEKQKDTTIWKTAKSFFK